LVILFSNHGSCLAATKRVAIFFYHMIAKKSMLNIFFLEILMTDCISYVVFNPSDQINGQKVNH
jgi:hypothetical protein